jgi:cytochrome c peroxidase
LLPKKNGIVLTEEQRQAILEMSPLPDVHFDETNQYSENPDAIIFGEKMYYSEQLSPMGVACHECHDPDNEFADAVALSEGANGTPNRNTPTIWNGVYNPYFNWDGSCDTLWCQATGPLEGHNEMDSSRVYLVHVISETLELRYRYLRLFGELPDTTDWPLKARPAQYDGDPLGLVWDEMDESSQNEATTVFVNISKSLAAFQIQLITQIAPIDYFVDDFIDNQDAALGTLTVPQREGLFLFVDNCVECHRGALFTNGEFYNTGLGEREWLNEDNGLLGGIEKRLESPFNAASVWSDDPTGLQAQRLENLEIPDDALGQFKVPSLRQISGSGPYMHGGHFDTLSEVMDFYSTLDETPAIGERDPLLVPLNLSETEKSAIIEFLKMLRARD